MRTSEPYSRPWHPQALGDLVARLDGDWHTELAAPDRRGIRVGLLSRTALSNVDQPADFLEQLAPVQVDDDATTVTTMGRPALHARVDVAGTPVDVACCHLKSKLLAFPGGRFSTSDEDERARYAVYALGRRAAEAATVRAIATQLLDGTDNTARSWCSATSTTPSTPPPPP